MARSASMSPGEALDAAQRALGTNRPHGSDKITSDTRGAVRAWLVAEGIPSTYVQMLSLASLKGLWSDDTNGTLAAVRVMAKNQRGQEVEAPIIAAQTEGDEFWIDEAAQLPLSTEGQPAPTPIKTKSDNTKASEEASKKLAEALQLITGLQQRPTDMDEDRVITLIHQHTPKTESAVSRIEIKLPDRPLLKTGKAPRHYAFDEILTAIAAGLNVLLVGPAGCGKTHLAEQIATALSLDFQFSGAVSSEYKLLGFIDAQGRTVTTNYRLAYENGALFLWDEIDASAAQAMLSFNAGLANGHQDFPDGIVKRHANFRAVASANTYGNGADRVYVGRNQLDAASLDRFHVIPMDYDEKLERTLYGDGEWTGYVHKARRAVRTLNLRHVVSMRAIDQGQKLLAAGLDRKAVERGSLWKHLSDADIAKVKAAM